MIYEPNAEKVFLKAKNIQFELCLSDLCFDTFILEAQILSAFINNDFCSQTERKKEEEENWSLVIVGSTFAAFHFKALSIFSLLFVARERAT